MFLNNELEKRMKKTVVAFFKVLSQNLPRWPETNHEKS
jgi:hypothetical protein